MRDGVRWNMTETVCRAVIMMLLVCFIAGCMGGGGGGNENGRPAFDPAVDAASKIGFTVPVMCREWHVWWGAPVGVNPQVPEWCHWSGLKRFGKFDPGTTIEETVPGSAWRRYLNCVGYPLLGPYDSGQGDVVRWQLETARNAGIDCLHVHLWPSLWDDGTDFTPLPVFDKILEAAERMGYPVGVHDEIMFRRPNITKAQQLDSTIARTASLVKMYGGRPGWKKIDGMPVYYFQNWTKWLNSKDMETYMTEVERRAGPVYWMVEMGTEEEFVRIPQIKMFFGPNNSYFLHAPPFGAGPHPWDTLKADTIKAKALAKKHGKKFGILVYTRFNNNNDRSEPGKGRIDAEDGMFYVKGLVLAKELEPDCVMLTQWNDFEECAFIEPAWDCDGFNGDPFRYCRITAASMGHSFTPAVLPRREELDPLIRHKLFGDTAKGDAGPVFHEGRVNGKSLEWKWCEGSGEPAEIRAVQRTLPSWTPSSPALGSIRLGNISRLDGKGMLKDKQELRFYMAGELLCEQPEDLWIGVRAVCPEGAGLKLTYRSEMENFRIDSRWERRQEKVNAHAFIDLGNGEKLFWFPLRGARFAGWEGDLTISAAGKDPCELKELLMWTPKMAERAAPVSWERQSADFGAAFESEKPFVMCAYDTLGNAGIPRVFFAGKTTPSPTKDPMDVLKSKQ